MAMTGLELDLLPSTTILLAQSPSQFFHLVRSTPVQAMSSHFLQDNAVGDGVKINLLNSR